METLAQKNQQKKRWAALSKPGPFSLAEALHRDVAGILPPFSSAPTLPLPLCPSRHLPAPRPSSCSIRDERPATPPHGEGVVPREARRSSGRARSTTAFMLMSSQSRTRKRASAVCMPCRLLWGERGPARGLAVAGRCADAWRWQHACAESRCEAIEVRAVGIRLSGNPYAFSNLQDHSLEFFERFHVSTYQLFVRAPSHLVRKS